MSRGSAALTPEQALSTIGGRIPGVWLFAWLAAIAIGVLGFVLTVGDDPQRAWMSVWMNFLLWTSVAMGGVVFGAVLQAAKGHWGKGFRRLAEAAGAFLPVSLLLFFLLRFGYDQVFPWIGPVETSHLNRTWLTVDGVFARNAILLTLLYVGAFVFLWYSIRADAPLMAARHSGWRKSLSSFFARGWRGDEEEIERCRRRLGRISPPLILAWAVVLSLLAFDFGMSLTPGFVSMIWGPYYFVGGWLCLLAIVAIMANHYQDRYGMALWGRYQFHDLGKLMFAFVVFWTYLWFSQFMIIWYGNLPREVNYFEPRMASPFRNLYWLQMILIFALPFPFLLGRKPKMNPRWLAFVAVVILVGFWVERYNVVVPSLWEGANAPLGLPEIMISLGFIGAFGLCYAAYITTFPKVPIRETIAVGSAGRGP